MKGWGHVYAVRAACTLALLGFVFWGLPAVGYVLEGFCLYIIYWVLHIVGPELAEDFRRELLWHQKKKGTLKWDK